MSADFFEPGHTYSDTDPANDWKFRVDHITTHPENGELAALGWRHFKGEWEPYAYFTDDWDIHQIAGFVATTSDEEKATATTAATATPNGPLGAGARNRLTLLRAAVVDYQGEWNTARAAHLYHATYGPGQWRATARRDLAQLCREGLLVLHDHPTNRHYTLNTRKDGRA